MIELTGKQTNAIADELELANRCFLNIKTHEIKFIPTSDEAYLDPDIAKIYEEEFDSIVINSSDYVEFEEPATDEIYRIMQQFSATITNTALKDKLNFALRDKKPLRRFKMVLELHSNEYARWKQFKRAKFIANIEEQIALFNLNLFDE
ncbi:MAG TPA: hypothetical protein DCQ31_10590 [Bacteroidales bacterium]|nr:hypothetical protein [Bacteroidales bacterium]